uniref:Adhesion G-protein coupled receptor G7 n=1 Tax=Balaenoptera musculus TaxID=9771 RepID=A0A8C0DD43_BALMU
MASCRACNLKVLVAIVTAVIWGLGIWKSVIRIQRGNSQHLAPPTHGSFRSPALPPGTVPAFPTRRLEGQPRCLCFPDPEGWLFTVCCEKSLRCGLGCLRCVSVNPILIIYPSPHLLFIKVGNPVATRLCSLNKYGEIELQNVTMGNRNENLETLEKQSQNISDETRILTSDASKLTPENITSATKVVGQIFNITRNALPEVKLTQLIEQTETYSLSLGNASVVEPNIAIQSVNFSSEGTVGSTGVLFTVLNGELSVSGSFVNANVDKLNLNEQAELQILLNTTKTNAKTCGFVVYQNNKLFQSKTFIAKSHFSQKIISSKTDENVGDQSTSVEMVFSPRYNEKELQLHSYACVYWNFSLKDWDTHGCHKEGVIDGFLRCRCNHTTNFAVLMSFKKEYKYPESLDVFSTFGCTLSIAGLVLTIIFQVSTRKVRKTSVTWVLVNLCTSMLIFNLLFVFGIENSNNNLKTSHSDTDNTDLSNNEMSRQDTVVILNPTCTAIAILLHYFVLVTFTWMGLSAAQLYFLLIRTMKPLPQHFILFISLIGWGVPAIVVAVTVGIIYSQNGNNSQWELDYRREEICWLATQESSGLITSPLLWSFIIPMIIILINNVVIFIVIAVKVLWKNNQNLKSTKVSILKNFLSTLSVAVLMLIDIDGIRVTFSYLFCLFNTTQTYLILNFYSVCLGLQTFILHIVRTKIFQSKASEVLKSLSLTAGRVKALPSMTSLRLCVRMYNMLRSLPALNERFWLLEPSILTKEMASSESDQENLGI